MPILPISEPQLKSSKTITFTGATLLGEIGAVPLLTVTGEVVIDKIVAFCTVNLAGATATLSLGVTGDDNLFIAATTATDIDAGDFWVDTAPDPNGIAIPGALLDIAITDNIVGGVLTANITGGAIRIDVLWHALSSDGNVT